MVRCFADAAATAQAFGFSVCSKKGKAGKGKGLTAALNVSCSPQAEGLNKEK